MSRPQRNSKMLEKGQIRLLKLKMVDASMDFGGDVNLQSLTEQTELLQLKLNNYNTQLANLDEAKRQIDQMERDLGDLLDKLFSNVQAKYGKDSREYEMAGGTRKSDRIRKISEGRAKSAAKKMNAIA